MPDQLGHWGRPLVGNYTANQKYISWIRDNLYEVKIMIVIYGLFSKKRLSFALKIFLNPKEKQCRIDCDVCE